MIRHTVIHEVEFKRVSEVRMSAEAAGGDMPPFQASCNLLWLSDTVLIVSMLTGEMTRAMWREFVGMMAELGVETVKARRAEGHVLPRLFRSSTDGSDHAEMSVAAAMAYAHRPSQWGDL